MLPISRGRVSASQFDEPRGYNVFTFAWGRARGMGKPIWDLGVDVVSGNTLSLLLSSLKPGGAVACSGLVGGPSFESSIFPFILRGNALLGIDSVEIPLSQKEEVWKNFASDWKLDLSKLVKEVPLEGLENEINSILQGGQVGRVLVNLN